MELNDLLNPTLIRWLIIAARADSECIAGPVMTNFGGLVSPAVCLSR
jgi:hypothetical protein